MINTNLFNAIFIFTSALAFILAVLQRKKGPALFRKISLVMIALPLLVWGIMEMFFARDIYFIRSTGKVEHQYLVGWSCNRANEKGQPEHFELERYQCLVINQSLSTYVAEPLVYVSDESERTVETSSVKILPGKTMKINGHQMDYLPGEAVPEKIWVKQSGTNYRWSLHKDY